MIGMIGTNPGSANGNKVSEANKNFGESDSFSYRRRLFRTRNSTEGAEAQQARRAPTT